VQGSRPMARQGGLGPQGRSAVGRAVQELHRAPAITEVPESNTGAPDEIETLPHDWWTFDSTRINEATYDSASERLYVRFVKPHGEGTPWTYENVPANVWRNLRRSQSPGRFVNRVLNNYSNHRGEWT
jgi:hypothetical protein